MRIYSQILDHLTAGIIIGSILLTPLVSYADAKTHLSDHKLETAVRMNGTLNRDALQQASVDAEQSQTKQLEASKEKASSINKQLQENSLDGSAMSDYLLQKKRVGEYMPAGKSADIPDVRRIVHQEKHENITISYPDGLVVEMKHN